MPSTGASARRATFDAIALVLAFLAVDALIVAAILTDLVDPAQGFVTILALAAVVLLLFRDDVADAVAAGNEKLGLTVDDQPVRTALDTLAGEDGWTVEHDFLSAHGRRIGTVVHGPSGSYLVETRNRTTGPTAATACGSWASSTWRGGCSGGLLHVVPRAVRSDLGSKAQASSATTPDSHA